MKPTSAIRATAGIIIAAAAVNLISGITNRDAPLALMSTVAIFSQITVLSLAHSLDKANNW